MVTLHRRSKAWEDFVEAERLYRYYHGLFKHYQRWRNGVRLSLFFALSGTVASALQNAPAQLVLGVALAVAILMGVDFLGDYARKSAVAFSISHSCGELVEVYQELWTSIENFEVDDRHVAAELRRLADETTRITGRSGDTELVERRRLNIRSAAEAYEVMAERYGVVQGT